MTRKDSIRKPTTLAEAIHVVEQNYGLSESAKIVMHVERMNLNADKHLHLVVLDYKPTLSDESSFIPLQSGDRFRATDNLTSQRREYAAELLDGGVVSHDAVFTLQDGTTLRAVEIVPDRLSYEFTAMDERIVHAAISVAQIEGAADRPETCPMAIAARWKLQWRWPRGRVFSFLMNRPPVSEQAGGRG